MSLLAGVLTGLTGRLFNENRHRITLFVTPVRIEAYLDGEMLNDVAAMPLDRPDINLILEQMLQCPHPALFLQYLNHVRFLDFHSRMPLWTFQAEPPDRDKQGRWGDSVLEYLGIRDRGGFGPVRILTLSHNVFRKDEFIIDIDVSLPIAFRLFFVDHTTGKRAGFNAEFYKGGYSFFQDDLHDRTQRYFIPDRLWIDLMHTLLFNYLMNVMMAVVFVTLLFITVPILCRFAGFAGKIRPFHRIVRYIRTVLLALKSTRLATVPLEAAIVGIIALLISIHISGTYFQNIPRVNDEGIYLFQAKVFAAGKWSVPPPEPRESFQHMGIWWQDRVFSYYTYGHSLLLAIGFLLECHEYIPAVLTGLAIFFTVLTGSRIYRSRLTGTLGGILLISSPLFILLGSSFMSHNSSILANMIFLYFLVRLEHDGKRSTAVATGLAWGAGFVIRPVTAIIFGALPLLSLVLRKPDRKQVKNLLIMGCCMAAMMATAYYHAYKTTGHWVLIQSQVEDRFEHGNDLTTTWKNLNQNGLWFLQRSFGWLPYLSLVFVFLPFLLLTRRKWDWIFLAGFVMNAVGYSCLAHFGWTHEPRYWVEFMPLIALLSARGIQRTGDVLQEISGSSVARGLVSIIGICCIAGLIRMSLRVFWPEEKLRYQNYCVNSRTYEKAMAVLEPNSIIFFAGHPDFIYIPFFYRNTLSFDGDIIYAIDSGDDINRRLMDKYPDRSVFRVTHENPVQRIR